MNFFQGLGLVALLVWNNSLVSKGSLWCLLVMLLIVLYVRSMVNDAAKTKYSDW
jgi:hypothetical protein